MIYYLDKSLIRRYNDNDSNINMLVHELATTIRNGDHLIFIDEDLLKMIIEGSRYDEYIKGIYKHVMEHNREYRAIRSKIGNAMVIYDIRDYVSDPNELKIDIDYVVTHMEIFGKCVLLCENYDDALLYVYITKWFIRNREIGNVTVKVSERGCGGSTIAQEYRNVCKGGETVAVAVADSDKYCPKGSVGGTVRVLRSVIPQGNHDIAKVVELRVREIENIISGSILERIYGETSSRKVLLAEKYGAIDAANYYDLKEGMTFEKSMVKCKRYWLEQAKKYGRNVFALREACIKREECLEAECKCIINEVVDDKIIEKVNSLLKEVSVREVDKLLSERCVEEWDFIGKELIIMCCGGSKMFI
jgi:hypothetical protein